MNARLSLGVLLVMGCAHPPVVVPVRLPPPPLEDALTLSRTACSGSCPVYSVTLHPDGRVHFVGTADVALVGERDWRIEPAFAKHLFGELDRARLGSLAPRYSTEVEEFPGLVLAFSRGGASHRVQLGGEGSAEAPRDVAVEKLLQRLALTIDKLVGDARFVATDPKRRGDGCVE